MINNSREKDFQGKQEVENDDNKLSKTTSNSRQWGSFKNPRIVRVSRSFGGKDRHSKVCTVRGLRDRRIRLSVPTAIQLYDLQDRVGLSQPSKVVDWLLDATKHEIDKLPPLQMPPGNFSQFNQQTLDPHHLSGPQSSLSPFFNEGTQPLLSSKERINKINPHVDASDLTLRGKSKYWDFDTAPRAKSKEVESESTTVENNKWITTNEQENQDGNGGYMAQLSAQNFFPIANQSFSGFPNTGMPYNPYYQWEPSNLSLSQFGSQGFSSQTDPHNSNSVSSMPSSLALPFFYPSTTLPPPSSLFPPYPPFMTTTMESDPRQVNHLQLLNSSSQHILPNSLVSPLHLISTPLNVHPKVHSQNHGDSQPNKGNDTSS